jgi:hypothetical protein
MWLTRVTFDSRKLPYIMFGFKNMIFDLISVHKFKLFLPLCLKSSVFIFVFTVLDSMATLSNTTFRKNDLTL